MRIGVVTFPGTLDDVDASRAVRLAGATPVSLWHADEDAAAGLLPGYSTRTWPCRIKGRAGVAVASRLPVSAVRVGLGAGEPEPPVDTGRWVEADLDVRIGASVYLVVKASEVGIYGSAGAVLPGEK